MARIPGAELEQLRRAVSVLELAREAGLELVRRGEDWVARCCFHEEATASLSIHPEKNLFHCFGCGASGNAVDWVMRWEHVSFRHAVEILRRRTGEVSGTETHAAAPATSPGLPPSARRVSGREPSPLLPRDAEDEELLARVVAYYHATLKESPEALSYLASRGLEHPELVDRFRLGFANRTLAYHLPLKATKAGAELRGRLQRLGILRESGHEHLNGRLIIPILGERGEVVQLYGRTITPNLRAGTPQHLYLPAPLRGVFHYEALGVTQEVILCEALIDALTFWCAGFRNVTSTFGVGHFTDEHVEAFRRHRIERVLIAFDRDEAGEQGARAVAQRLQAVGIACYRVQFPRGLDANAYAQKVQPAEKSLELVLRHAQWMGEGAAPAVVLSTPLVELSALSSAASPRAEEETIDEISEPEPPAQEASPSPLVPVASRLDVPCEVKGEEVVITLGDRRYRIRGLDKNLSYDLLKVNVLAARGEAFHVDTLDLYSARQRGAYAKEAARELGVEEEVARRDLGRVLLKLEELQDRAIRHALEPQAAAPAMSAEDREAALGLLRDPHLLERIVADLERCGVVGETTNKLVCYLAAISRKQSRPLAVVIQSSSAAGKSALMNAVLSLVPEEERVSYSAMTGQSLFYMAEKDLKHKVLAIAEEEGAERASYALKLLQSEGELSIASTGKDPQTGRLVTHEYQVEGPVAIFLTTTAIEVDEELLNRCLVLTVDEEREQTRAIHAYQRQRETLAGQLALERRQAITTLHRNAQRLLQPLRIANPWAEQLTFPDSASRTRRDHEKYLGLIRAVTLLHQHQRALKRERIDGVEVEHLEVTLDDIALANQLAREVLSRSLDELSPQTRHLLILIDQLVAQACERLQMARCDYRFGRKEVRAFTGWGDTQLKLHLHRLESLEYLLVHKGGRGQSFVYELLYEVKAGDDDRLQLSGLIDVERLRTRVCPASGEYDGKKSGFSAGWSGLGAEKSRSSRPQVGGMSGGGRSRFEPGGTGVSDDFEAKTAETAHLDAEEEEAPSYGVARHTPAPRNGTPLPSSSSAALLSLARRTGGQQVREHEAAPPTAVPAAAGH